jgi:hypothetical protein
LPVLSLNVALVAAACRQSANPDDGARKTWIMNGNAQPNGMAPSGRRFESVRARHFFSDCRAISGPSTIDSIDEAAFALVTDGEDIDAIFCGQEAIQRDVT